MKKIGMSFSYSHLLGRVIGDPIINNGWATLTLRTVVPEPKDGGGWNEVEIDLPLMTNDPKKMDAIQKYVADERQLYIDGYIKTWTNNGVQAFGIIITNLKLGNKNMFDDEAQKVGAASVPPAA